MHVLFLAKGTRGDVQPVALLAHALRACNPRLLLHFVTHRDHQHWLSEVVGSCNTEFTYLDSVPARVWHVQPRDATLSKKRTHQQTLAMSAQSFQSDSELEESIAAVQSLLALHIAECLCVPCLAVSPCLVPYTFPVSFPRRFKKACPALYAALQSLCEGQVSWSEVEHWLWPAFSPRWTSWRQKRLHLSPTLFDVNTAAAPPTHPLHCTSEAGTGTVNTSGGCHTPSEADSASQGMDKGTSVDANQKRRGSIIGGSNGGHVSSGCGIDDSSVSTGSGNGCDKGGGHDSDKSGSGSGNKGGSGDSSGSCSLPASIPLLYGLSEQVIMRPGYWPSSVHCCGFWQQKHICTDSIRKQKLSALLETVLPQSSLEEWQSGQPLLCIDYGSMGCLGLIPDPNHLVAVLVTALQKAGAKGILLTGGWKPLLLAANKATQELLEKPVLIVAGDSIPHSLLLPECSGVIHHGGAGTCAAVLTAGLPHLVCPFHFDQFAWAERLVYLGVAIQGSTESLVGSHPVSTSPLAKAPSQRVSVSVPALHGSTSTNLADTCPPNPPGADPPDKSTADNQPQPPASLTAAHQLVDQLKILLSGQLNKQCESLQAALQGEDGIGSAVNILLQQLANAAVPRRNAIPPLQLSDASNLHEAEGRYCTRPDSVTGSQQRVDAEALVMLPNGWQVAACSEAEAMFIYHEIVDQQCYLQEGIRIHNGDVVLDIGANIGLFTWWVLQKAPGRGQAGRVLAVEPMSRNVAVMQANLQQYYLTNQVHIVSQAVGHTEGEAMFRYYPAMPGNSTCCVREKEQLQREHMAAHFFADSQDCICPVTTISHLMDQHGVHEVNLLKIDVEGCELEVLQGIQPRHWSQISQIVLEVHDTAGRLHQIIAMLEAEKYVVACKQGMGPETHMVYARRT